MAADPTGAFVVVWSGAGPGAGSGIFARRFDSGAAPLGSQFQVNTTSGYTTSAPRVDVDGAGRFVVAWSRRNMYDYTHLRRFDSDGSPLGDESSIDSGDFWTDLLRPDVAMASSGEFVVVWGWNGLNYGAFDGVRGRRFASDGSSVGTFEVTMEPSFYYGKMFRDPRVDADDAGFVVAWESYWGPSVEARAYDSEGNPLTGVLEVTPSIGEQPDLTCTNGGGFLVVWDESDEISGRYYDASGSPLDTNFQVNVDPAGLQSEPAVAAGTVGEFVAWSRSGIGPDSVFARVLPSTNLFADGFESGGTDRWSRTIPQLLNLVSLWCGDGDASDLMNLNHGYAQNGLGYASGVCGQAFDFDGVDDHVVVPDSPSLDVGANDFSLAFWVKAHEAGPGVMDSLLDKRSSTNTGYSAYVWQGRPGLQLAVNDQVWENFWPDVPYINAGQFHFVVISVERSLADGGGIYVDGTLARTFDPRPYSASLDSPADLRIGTSNVDVGGTDNLWGLLDEIQLYRGALSQEDVQALMAECQCGN